MIISSNSSRLMLVLLLGCAPLAEARGTPQQPQGDAPQSQFRIAGTVVNSISRSPLPLVRVVLRDVRNTKDVQSVLTGDDGHFEFQVKAGKYSLHGAKRGFISGDYDQHEQFSSAIVTGAGLATENLILKLAPSAVLGGRVLDELGEPVRGAQVSLWHEDHASGVSRITRVNQSVVDDQGVYEFTPLDVGIYFLSVSATPWYAVHPASYSTAEGVPAIPSAVDRGLDVVYPTTYYAGATESDDASPISVRGGDHLEIDLHLTPVPALHIAFRTQPTEPNHYLSPVLTRRAFDGFEPRQGPPNIQTIAPGMFEMVTAPGKYSVHLIGEGQSSQINEVDLSQDHQVVDASSGEATASVHASVHLLGGQTLPSEFFVGLREGQRRGTTYQPVTAQGEVQFEGLASGTYDIVAVSSDYPYSVVQISSEGHEKLGRRLKVTPGAVLSVSLTLVRGGGIVEGAIRQAGKPVAGAMVVLVPKLPESNPDLFRRDQSDLDGTFTLQRVIPGMYTVVAIVDGWDLDWSKPHVISKYVARGQTVVVRQEAYRPIRLPEPLEVQSK